MQFVSKCGSRLSTTRIRVKDLQTLHGLRSVPFRNVALVLAPCTFVVKMSKIVTVSQYQRTKKTVFIGR
eukprot:3974774-Pyramimonas_sp.AAC.1